MYALVCAPLAIRPGAIVEIGSFSTHDVKTPAWRKVLELIILNGCLSFLTALVLHWYHTCRCAHKKGFISTLKECILTNYQLHDMIQLTLRRKDFPLVSYTLRISFLLGCQLSSLPKARPSVRPQHLSSRGTCNVVNIQYCVSVHFIPGSSW